MPDTPTVVPPGDVVPPTGAAAEADIDAAYAAIRAGGLALVPADIGYGFLGHSRRSIETMYRIKGRAGDNPCIAAGTPALIADLDPTVPPTVRAWIDGLSRQFTVAVIVAVTADNPLVAGLDPWVRDKVVTEGSIALFLRSGRFVEGLVDRALADGVLLVGSSGNRSGTGNNFRYEDVPASIRSAVDFSVDWGPMRHANPEKLATSIVRLRDLKLLRRGVGADVVQDTYRRALGGRDGLPAELEWIPKGEG